MIHRKVNFGKTKGIMVCEMGFGDVEMNLSAKGDDGQVVLAFKTAKTPMPINVVHKSPYSSFDEMKPQLIFVFHKAESIDSVIAMLEDCKKEFLKG